MKNVNILLIVILVTVLSCSFDKKSISSKTLVESRTTKYKYVDGKLDSTGTLYERIIFDKQGRDSIFENYNVNGSLFLRTNLYYDSAGKKVKSVDYKADGKVESTTEYKYSETGKIRESFREHAGGGFNRGQFIYDSLGNRINEVWTSKWHIGNLDEWYTSEDILLRVYNDKGYCIGVKESADGKPFKDKKTVFDSLGHIIYEDWGNNFRKFRYDKNGNQIEELSLDINKKLVNRWVSVYDTNNVHIAYYTYNELNEPTELLKKEFIYR
jgi:hypothetical protein